MSKGTCLCGAVTWEISGEPVAAYHCHCAMCRKAHGAAFGTYYFMRDDDFRWTGDTSTVMEYNSSPTVRRAFCDRCGSVVPCSNPDNGRVGVPAGSHTDGPAVQSHIFVGSMAPWHEIGDDLPRHAGYAPESNDPEYPDKVMDPPKAGVLRGGCLCATVEFEVSGPFKVVHNCHCSRCRQARAAAFTTNGFTSMDSVRYTRGEARLRSYKLPEARYFTHVFCDVCGSGMPRIDTQRKIAVVPLGALDDDPCCLPQDNIFLADKADWFDPGSVLPGYPEGPPG